MSTGFMDIFICGILNWKSERELKRIEMNEWNVSDNDKRKSQKERKSRE